MPSPVLDSGMQTSSLTSSSLGNLRLHPDPLSQNLHLTRSLGDSNVHYKVRSTFLGHSSKALWDKSVRSVLQSVHKRWAEGLRTQRQPKAAGEEAEVAAPRQGPCFLRVSLGVAGGLPRGFQVTCPLKSDDRAQPTRSLQVASCRRKRKDGWAEPPCCSSSVHRAHLGPQAEVRRDH